MNIKVYLAGILSILATLIIVVLGASLLDTEAASNDEEMSQTADFEEENDAEFISNPEANVSEDDEETKYADLMQSYNDLVAKYNEVVGLIKEASLDKDESIKEIINSAAEIITEMGETDLDSATEDDIADIEESVELMNELLDELIDGVKAYSGDNTASSDDNKEELVINYEKPDFSVTTTNGDNFTLYDQGGNVVVVSFFATWCNPCKEEMQYLQKLNEKFKEDDVKIISICCGEGNSATEKFMNNNGFSYLAAGDSNGSISEDYNVGSIPYTVIFDKTGKVVAEYEGLYDYSDYENAIANAK